MDRHESPSYPLHIARALAAAEKACGVGDSATCHEAVLRLADALVYYLGAVAVAQYSQALLTGQIEADPTLSRSLRSLRRVLPGQWLGWAARGISALPIVPIQGLAEWYSGERSEAVTQAYNALRSIMAERLSYTGEYGPRAGASPRLLLELIDQYHIRRGKTALGEDVGDIETQVAHAILRGLQALLREADFLAEYPLYAPQQRQLLMGAKATTPMPPLSAPTDAAGTILIYPPGEMPDYTKRPNLQAERLPLFPLDPLLVYIPCGECDRPRMAALQEVVGGLPSYLGLDPECGHRIEAPLPEGT